MRRIGMRHTRMARADVSADPVDRMVSRRRFLSRLSIGLSALAGLVVGVPIVSYLLSPLINPAPDMWRAVGSVDQFKIGDTVQVAIDDPSPLAWAGQTARTAAWLRRTGPDSFSAFWVNCTHLGCPVNWRPDSQLFLCPCHGGVYYADGSVAGGPPPHALFHMDTRVRGGNVEVLAGGLPLS
jgi:menaquinol-cytochrome c reductase iron-sulfur subunit